MTGLISTQEAERRFGFHPANGPDRARAHEEVRAACRELAEKLSALMPAGREAACALTKVEEVMFWANAAVAREGK